MDELKQLLELIDKYGQNYVYAIIFAVVAWKLGIKLLNLYEKRIEVSDARDTAMGAAVTALGKSLESIVIDNRAGNQNQGETVKLVMAVDRKLDSVLRRLDKGDAG